MPRIDLASSILAQDQAESIKLVTKLLPLELRGRFERAIKFEKRCVGCGMRAFRKIAPILKKKEKPPWNHFRWIRKTKENLPEKTSAAKPGMVAGCRALLTKACGGI